MRSFAKPPTGKPVGGLRLRGTLHDREPFGGGDIELVLADIARQRVVAIEAAAKSSLQTSGGVCGTIDCALSEPLQARYKQGAPAPETISAAFRGHVGQGRSGILLARCDGAPTHVEAETPSRPPRGCSAGPTAIAAAMC